MVPHYRWHLSYKICFTINFLHMDLTNLLSRSICLDLENNYHTMSLHTTFSIISKSITDSSEETAASFQHSMFSHKCTSASLDCPYNTLRTVPKTGTPQPSKEPPIQETSSPLPAPTPTKTPVNRPGELSGLNETLFFF